MDIRPRVLFDRPLPSTPKVSLILLDWSCRESFHIFDYLAKQDVPRDWFEVLWIEYFDLAAEDIARRIAAAQGRGAVPPVDRWITLDMPRTAYYHKHVMYNLGVLASRGDLVMIGDSDAMVTSRFVRTLVEAFDRDRDIVLHLDEVRSHNRSFYPFNYPSFAAVLGDGCINWRDGKTTGLLDEFDPLHARNYGACICARRDDVIAIGGADEHLDYLGHVCGPYDLTWRLVNFGRREAWHDAEFLYHVWHPGSDGDDNYMGPHDGRQVSTLALQAKRTGRVMPLVENPIIRELREGRTTTHASLAATLADAIGARPFTEWVIDDTKRAVSAGRTAFAQHRYADALAAWQPVLGRMPDNAQFLSELGWTHYYLGDYAAASDAFNRSLALDEDNPDAWRGRGWTLANRGDTRGAIDAFTRSIRIADPLLRAPLQEAHRGRAWAYLHDGQLAAAHDDFSVALALSRPDDVGSLQDLNRGFGWVCLQQGRPADAQRHFSEAVRHLGRRRGPEYENAISGLAKADAQLADAVRALTQPASASGVAAGADVANAQRLHVRSRLAADLADAYYGARRYENALKLFKEAAEIDSAHWRAVCGAGWAELQLGRLARANATFKRVAAQAGSTDPATLRHALHGRGWVAYREGRVRDAMKEFVRALRVKSTALTAEERREIDEVKRGLRRAQYLARTGDVSLRDIARHEQAPLLRIAVDLQRRAWQGRMVSWRTRARSR